jgi:hypothetical protein
MDLFYQYENYKRAYLRLCGWGEIYYKSTKNIFRKQIKNKYS